MSRESALDNARRRFNIDQYDPNVQGKVIEFLEQAAAAVETNNQSRLAQLTEDVKNLGIPALDFERNNDLISYFAALYMPPGVVQQQYDK